MTIAVPYLKQATDIKITTRKLVVLQCVNGIQNVVNPRVLRNSRVPGGYNILEVYALHFVFFSQF